MKRYRSFLLAAAFGAALAPVWAMPAAAAAESGALITAVQDGLEKQVAALIARHADVNAIDNTGATSLAWAVMRGNAPIVSQLLKAHANPDIADANGMTPLMLAIDNNSPASVKLLLEHGANANLGHPNGETPLMNAVQAGSADIVKMLLDAKADVNAREADFGQTALMWAAGHPDIVRLLLDRHADTRPVTKSWQTASTNYTPGVTTMGITGIPWNNDGDYVGKAGGVSALMFAVQKDDIDSAKMLLDAGMDVNASAADGTTALLTSLYKWKKFAIDNPQANRGTAGETSGVRFAPNLKMAGLLLDRGAHANASDRAGYTPLHGAILGMINSGQRSFLIGFNPNRTSKMMPAAPKPPPNEAEALPLIKRLLELGADPNKMTIANTPGPLGAIKVNPAPPGSTPLHIAAASHSPQLVELMMTHGANPNLVRKDGHTAFSVAVMMNDLQVVTVMAEHGADLAMLYNPADKLPDPVLSKAEARKNQTILHVAAGSDANYVVEYLASKGAALQLQNDHGETPINLADQQELFRYNHDLETQAADRVGSSKAVKIERDFSTTDAFRRASGAKSRVASN